MFDEVLKDPKNHTGPPKLGTFLLRKIYDDQLFQEISGDMEEIFTEQLHRKGRLVASFNYLIDAILSIRNHDLRRSQTVSNNSVAMLKNYLKITLRTMSKNKVYTGLNILGLALGVAAFIFILQYVTYERSYDTFHTHYKDIYRVKYLDYEGGELRINCAAAVPRVGPFMKEKMPEVIDFARAYPISGIMSVDHIMFREERIHIADPAFLKIFDYPMLYGDRETALEGPNKVVITESTAQKYFGKTDVVGEFITYSSWLDLTLEVSGVTVDVPNNSHLKYDFLISYECLNNYTREEDGSAPSETDWGWYDFNTYVLLEPGTDPAVFDAKFDEYLWEERGERFEKYNYRSKFPLQPIADIHLYSNLLQESEPEEQGDGQAVFFLTVVAFFILILAWINYINLATARSVDRAKEVGIRKTLGAIRKELVYQFLSEALVLNFLAVLLALLIVLVGIRYFNSLTESQISLAFLSNQWFWFSSIGVFLGGALLSGLYPALVLSSFRPIAILKGKFSGNRSGQTLRKGLVVFQFTASVVLISGTMIVFQQLRHLQEIDLGFSLTNTLVVKGPETMSNDSLYVSKKEAFANGLLTHSVIEAISASSNVPGDEIFWTSVIKQHQETEDKFRSIYISGIDYEYFEAFDIALVAGRNYDRSYSTDTGSVILNEAAVRHLGFASPEAAINQKVTFWNYPKTIIGVVGDFNQMSVKQEVSPIIFPLALDEVGYFTFKLKTGNYQQAYEEVQMAYTDFFPGNPFDHFFLDDFFNRQYRNDRKFSRVFTMFSIFGIIIASLGLFGLSSFSALQRTKEIGIRKTLGARVGTIVLMLVKEFMILICIANVIAWPLTYFFMKGWLESFTSRVGIGVPVFLLAGAIVLVTALLTVGYKTFTAAKSNPVRALRYE